METEPPQVLLIGKSNKGHSPLSHRLRSRGCDCRFAASYDEVDALLEKHSFDLTLGPIKLNGDNFYPLISRLAGSRTTLFYSLSVEDGGWWLPALRSGVHCFGAPAIHRSEFASVLEKTIAEIMSRTGAAVQLQPPIGNVHPNSAFTPKAARKAPSRHLRAQRS
jgi:hypothetical protein